MPENRFVAQSSAFIREELLRELYDHIISWAMTRLQMKRRLIHVHPALKERANVTEFRCGFDRRINVFLLWSLF